MGQTTGRDLVTAIDQIAPAIQAALPEHVSFDRFRRVVLTAIQADPDLVRADRRALLTACLKAAQDGLMPDKREGVIMMFKGVPQWMPMVGGLMKLARNSGEILSIRAHVVYAGEPFRVLLGDEERIEHLRDVTKVDHTKIVAVYAIAQMREGDPVREVMPWKDVLRVKASSASGDKGPWGKWPDEMARKTVIRRLVKRLPLSTDRDGDRRLAQAVERVDEDHPQQIAGQASHTLLADETGGRLDALEQQLAAGEPAPIKNASEDDLRALATDDTFPG
jgi:recombination protein RecT